MVFSASTSFSLKVGLIAGAIYCTKQYMQGGMCKSSTRLDGKIAIITGANTGIGKANAVDFICRGAKVYMACRSIARGEAAAKDIKEHTGVSDDKLIVMRLDLGSVSSVREFSEEFQQKETKLDLLINNAGAMFTTRALTEDGIEKTFGVNYIGPFLLTNLLLDKLRAGAPSRIINVSSFVHKMSIGQIDFDDIMNNKSYSYNSAYGRSKTANILFTKELAKRLNGSGVNTYAANPGIVRTELGRERIHNLFPLNYLWNFIYWPIYKDPIHGAQTQICCAVSENLANDTGNYYSDCVEAETSDQAKDPGAAKKLWDLTEEILNSLKN